MNPRADILDAVQSGTAARSDMDNARPEPVIGSPQISAERQSDAGRSDWFGVCNSAALQISARWDPEEFAQQQILGLVQRVFFPGWPRPARQVVFSTVDGTADAGTTCARVSVVMAERLPGTVCAIEAVPHSAELRRALVGKRKLEIVRVAKGLKDGQPVQSNLWLLTAEEFYAEQKPGAAWLRNRVSELRRAFDYVVIHAPCVSSCSETALIGQMTDGVILVLDEQRTRRAAAQQVKEILLSANARLLGVVLSERQFPIPEQIYRRH